MNTPAGRRILQDATRVIASNMRARAASPQHAAVWTASLAGVALVMVITWPAGAVEPQKPQTEAACWMLYATLVIATLLASGYSSGRTSSFRALSITEWVKHTTVSPAGLVAGQLGDAWIMSCLFLVSTTPLFLVAFQLGALSAAELASGLGFIVALLVPFSVAGLASRVLIEGQDPSSLALDAYLVAVLVATAFLPGTWARLNPVIALADVIHRSPRPGPVLGGVRLPGWLVPVAAYSLVSVALCSLSVRKLSRRRKGGLKNA